MIFFAKNKHSLPLCFSTLADKSCDPFDFCGNTGSNGTGAGSNHAFVKLFPITTVPCILQTSMHKPYKC